MKLRKLNKVKDLEQINKMLSDYKWEPWDSDLYGKYYFVAVDKGEIVLFGGMYLYDVKVYGRLGLVLASKNSTKEQRNEAFNMLFSKLFSICEKNKVKGIEYASSNDFMINRLVKEYGFVKHTKKDSDMLHKTFSIDLSFLNESE